jgi:hypothetical protein
MITQKPNNYYYIWNNKDLLIGSDSCELNVSKFNLLLNTINKIIATINIISMHIHKQIWILLYNSALL